MKQYVFSLALALAAVSAQAAQLDGSWQMKDGATVKARECSSGATPDDAFKPGRDQAAMEINGSQVLIMSSIHGVADIKAASIDQTPLQIRYTTDAGEKVDVPLSLESANVLYLYGSNFGEGGTCPRGDTLRIRFERSGK